MAEKFHSRFDSQYDFSQADYIVIGSGVGGLSSAVFLAKAGKKVVVLEQHYVPGGFSHTFKRKDGFEWDVGVHYIGNLNEDDSQLRVLFNYLSDNRLKWEFMGEVYDKAIIDGDEYLFPSGRENFRTWLHNEFPAEKDAIDTYLKIIDRASKRFRFYIAEKVLPPILRSTLGRYFRKLLRPYSSISTYDQLRKITSNEKLISVLCAQCGNYGLSPQKSSFAAHAIVVNHFLEGGYYPVGGASNICNSMVETLTKNGGKVFINAEVKEIVTHKNRVTGLRVNDTLIDCKRVISNAGIYNTFSNLLSEKVNGYLSRSLNGIKPSTPHVCLYIGLDASDEELNLPRHNIWFYEDYGIDRLIDQNMERAPEKIEFAYVSFPSAKDPAWAATHPGKSTIQAISVGNYEWFREYEDEPWRNRSDDYQQWKADFEEKMLEKLYELLPQIKGHIAVTEVSTPLSTRHFTNHQNGEIYGLSHGPDRFDIKTLRPKTPVKGLYLAGQDIAIVGVSGALLSGMMCAIEILRFGIYREFRRMARENKDVG